MKIKLIGKNLADIRPVLKQFNLREVADGEEFELVVAHGGDGTLFQAETQYPGVPKLPLRDAGTAPLCGEHSYEKQLQLFVDGLSPLTLLPKLSGEFNGKILYGINDIFIHNRERVSALRYRVRIDGELYAHEIVGDGAGVSSVHGSTAYYRSITHSIFKVGLGLAFSNSTAEVDHLVVADSSVIEIEIVRGPGILVADNSPEWIDIPEGGTAVIRQSAEYAKVYNLPAFMCQCCRLLRHPNRFEERIFAAALAGKTHGVKVDKCTL